MNQASFGVAPPIYIAAVAGHADIVVALLDATAHIDACDARGVTALHVAAQNGQCLGVLIPKPSKTIPGYPCMELFEAIIHYLHYSCICPLHWPRFSPNVPAGTVT